MKKHRHIIFIKTIRLLAVFLLVTNVTQVQAQTVVALAEEQSMNGQGFAFRPIKGWKVRKLNSANIVSIESKDSSSNVPVSIIIQMSEIKNLPSEVKNLVLATNPSESSLDSYFASFAEEFPKQTLLEKEKITVGGKTGYVGKFKPVNCKAMKCYLGDKIALIKVDNSNYLTVLGISQLDKWQYDKEFDAILDSIRFFQKKTPKTETKSNNKSQTQQPSQKPKKENKIKKKLKDTLDKIIKIN